VDTADFSAPYLPESPGSNAPAAPEAAPDSSGGGATAPTAEGGPSGDELAKYMENMSEEIDGMKGSLAETDKRAKDAEGKLGAIKGVFNPNEKIAETKFTETMREHLDKVMETALDNERKGQGGIPYTVQAYALMTQMADKMEKQQDVIKEMQGKMDIHTDPEYSIDQRAFQNMDSFVDKAVADMMGGYDANYSKMVASKIIPVIKQMKEKAPEKWDML